MLPNFCRGRGTQNINDFKDKVDNIKEKPIITPSKGPSINSLQNKIGELYDISWQIQQQSTPGNPDYVLNKESEADIYSNSGADGRYRDTKAIYEKDYLTTINLGIGIILSLVLISKKA